jgi:hypothetical protein
MVAHKHLHIAVENVVNTTPEQNVDSLPPLRLDPETFGTPRHHSNLALGKVPQNSNAVQNSPVNTDFHDIS